MSNRLKILSMEECFPYPRFSTESLEEMLDMTPAEIEERAAREGWKRVTAQEFDENDELIELEMWDATTMPVETRTIIAMEHYQIEEDELPLICEVEDEVSRLMLLFPGANQKMLTAALYRARQFECIRDAATSLRIPPFLAFEALGAVFGVDSSVFQDLSDRLDGEKYCSFITSDADTRLLMLMQHFSECTEELLPEFPSSSSKPASEGVLQ